MPFDLSVIRDGATYSLTAGTPYKLASAEGLAYPAIQRVTMRAPAQDGDVDYGFYLEPRTITLALSIEATSGSALDGHRDTLFDIFRPDRAASFSNPTGDPRIQAQTPLTLQVTRDDGEVRRIDCYVSGPLDVPVVTEHRPGHLHRAAVQLVAPNPTWYGTAVYSDSYPSISSVIVALGTIAYAGTYYADPIITIGGSVDSPHIWNMATTGTIGYDTLAVPTFDDTFVVDVQTGRTELNGTVPTQAVTPKDLTPLRILPAPLATGGTNTFRITANSAGSESYVSIQYRDRFLSY